jgi:soluble lytic murein transglycosylase-like protein
MPGTASQLGVDPWDVNQNIDGGVRYLAQLYNRYGSWDRALTAYGGFVTKSPTDYLRAILQPIGLWPGSDSSPAGTSDATGDDEAAAYMADVSGGPNHAVLYILLGVVVVAGVLWTKGR